MINNGSIFGKDIHLKYFFESAFKGYLELVKLFVENGFEIDSIDIDGETPLFKAVRGNSYSVSKYLFTKGANLNICNKYGKSLIALIENSNHKLLKNFFDESKCKKPDIFPEQTATKAAFEKQCWFNHKIIYQKEKMNKCK